MGIFNGGFKVRTLKVKSISVMLVFSMMLAMFMPLFPVTVYAAPDTRTQITRINLHATSGTTVAEYGATITQPVVEIVSSDPTGAVSYWTATQAEGTSIVWGAFCLLKFKNNWKFYS